MTEKCYSGYVIPFTVTQNLKMQFHSIAGHSEILECNILLRVTVKLFCQNSVAFWVTVKNFCGRAILFGVMMKHYNAVSFHHVLALRLTVKYFRGHIIPFWRDSAIIQSMFHTTVDDSEKLRCARDSS